MIVISSAEGSKELVRYRPLNSKSVANLAHLHSGDVAFFGNGPAGSQLIGIEVKNPADLVQSISKNRLQTQIARMQDVYAVSYLLVYGDYKCGSQDRLLYRSAPDDDWTDSGVKYLFVESVMLDIADCGIRIKSVCSIDQAAIWIAACARQWSKDWSQRGERLTAPETTSRDALRAKMKRKGINKDYIRRATFIQGIPGVGAEKALAILDHFDGCVMDALSATPAQLSQAPGVGVVVAGAIHQFLRRKAKKA